MNLVLAQPITEDVIDGLRAPRPSVPERRNHQLGLEPSTTKKPRFRAGGIERGGHFRWGTSRRYALPSMSSGVITSNSLVPNPLPAGISS
jgi:hypothetical protein